VFGRNVGSNQSLKEAEKLAKHDFFGRLETPTLDPSADVCQQVAQTLPDKTHSLFRVAHPLRRQARSITCKFDIVPGT